MIRTNDFVRLRAAVRSRLQEGDKLFWNDVDQFFRIRNEQLGTEKDYYLYRGCILELPSGHVEPLPEPETVSEKERRWAWRS